MSKAPQSSFQWFREARFGMFVHYGLYSLLGRHEWAICYERIPRGEYMRLADRFNPRQLRIGNWVDLAKRTGMRYLCLTTRHHDGFALFDTKASEFNSMNTPARRDLVREYVEACRKAKMGVGLYYSVGNWTDDGFLAGPKKDPAGWKRFVDVAHRQLRELMTNYGKIRYLFYDGCPPPKTWQCDKINAEIRRLQPGILISSRCGTEEDVMSAEGYTIGDPGKPWETCMTTNKSWGYNYGDSDWKTVRQAVMELMTCAHNGGNYLLNVGPMADGIIPQPAVRLLTQIGQWLRKNGQAVYGTEPHPFAYADQKLSTSRGKTAYVAMHFYHGPETVIAGIGNRVRGVRVLGTGKRVAFKQNGNRILLRGLPKANPDPVLPILAFDLDGAPKGVPNPLLGSKTKYQ